MNKQLNPGALPGLYLEGEGGGSFWPWDYTQFMFDFKAYIIEAMPSI